MRAEVLSFVALFICCVVALNDATTQQINNATYSCLLPLTKIAFSGIFIYLFLSFLGKEIGGSTLKTATKWLNIFIMPMSMFGFLACTFGDPTYDHDSSPTLTSTESGGAKFNLSQGGSGSTDCPCSIVSIQSYKSKTGFTVYKNVLGLKPGEFCVCSPTGGTTGTVSTNVAGSGSTLDPPPVPQGGIGNTEDPPNGGTTWTDYPSFGGDSSIAGASAVGGDGSTLDPPPTGGTGNTQDPPVGGKGNMEDPPPNGGTSAAGGATGTAGSSSVTGGTGNTQDPPPAGAAGIAGMTGAGGGSTLDPPVGGKSSTGGASATGGSSATGGAKATGGSPSTGGTSATGGNTGTGGSTCVTPPNPQQFKLWMRNQWISATYKQICVGQETGMSVDCTTTSSYCYLTIPDLARENWSCHLDVTGNTTVSYLPQRDANQQCANPWNIVPYRNGDLIEGTHWKLEEWKGECVFTVLKRAGGFWD